MRLSYDSSSALGLEQRKHLVHARSYNCILGNMEKEVLFRINFLLGISHCFKYSFSHPRSSHVFIASWQLSVKTVLHSHFMDEKTEAQRI